MFVATLIIPISARHYMELSSVHSMSLYVIRLLCLISVDYHLELWYNILMRVLFFTQLT